MKEIILSEKPLLRLIHGNCMDFMAGCDAKQGDTILDTHLGSASSAIAAYDMGFDFTGIELDEEYFEAAVKRVKLFLSEPKADLFGERNDGEQLTLI